MTRDEIYSKVQEVLIDALGVDDDEVTADARLTKDLGAESIDFLDITFKLEQEFDFKIGQGELFPDNAASNPDFIKDGKLTPEGLTAIKEKLPHVDFSKLESDPQISRLAETFTVDALVSFVERKLQTANA